MNIRAHIIVHTLAAIRAKKLLTTRGTTLSGVNDRFLLRSLVFLIAELCFQEARCQVRKVEKASLVVLHKEIEFERDAAEMKVMFATARQRARSSTAC